MTPTRVARTAWRTAGFVLWVTASWGASAALAAQAGGQAEGIAVSGRVLDLETGNAVPDAAIALLGAGLRDVTDAEGLFVFEGVLPGTYVIRMEHLVYGRQEETVEVGAHPLAIRIDVSPTAIRLDPVVVETRSRREADERARGSQVNVLDREEIDRYSPTSRHLGDALRQAIPGIRVREGGPVSGAVTCIEFRTVGTPRFARGCKLPTVFLDGVRMNAPEDLLTSINLSDINRVEVIPPSEAGVLYGTESMFGVILIETRVWAQSNADRPRPRVAEGQSVHDWTLERSGHAWKKVYAGAFIGNAAGLLLGMAAARECIEFDELSNDLFNTSCGGWGTAGARAALITLPVLGASVGARAMGGTDLSHGKFLHAAVASTVVLVPAYALVSSSFDADFTGTRVAGQILLVVVLPAAATLADKLFRKIRGADEGP